MDAPPGRRKLYRMRRAQARALAMRARESTLALTNGDQSAATEAYGRVLWAELSRLLNESTPTKES